jgi:uncharacterized small protein (DUF1192 family)
MKLQTKKQKQYFHEVIRLHCERGWGEGRISRVIPVGHATVSRRIAIFASDNEKKAVQMTKKKNQQASSTASTAGKDETVLQAEIARLQAQVKHEKLRADACDEMINVAESKFNISIRKKAGAKR